MNEQEFKGRTKKFALQVIRLVESLPRSKTRDRMGRQWLRCATSVGANDRAACRGKSVAEVVAKLGIVEEEADESMYWMDWIVESEVVPTNRVTTLKKEADELVPFQLNKPMHYTSIFQSTKGCRWYAGLVPNSWNGTSRHDGWVHQDAAKQKMSSPKSEI